MVVSWLEKGGFYIRKCFMDCVQEIKKMEKMNMLGFYRDGHFMDCVGDWGWLFARG